MKDVSWYLLYCVCFVCVCYADHGGGVVVNDFGGFPKNITKVGSLTSVPYAYTVTPLVDVMTVVKRDVGAGKI